jgi:hypothetical protein
MPDPSAGITLEGAVLDIYAIESSHAPTARTERERRLMRPGWKLPLPADAISVGRAEAGRFAVRLVA